MCAEAGASFEKTEHQCKVSAVQTGLLSGTGSDLFHLESEPSFFYQERVIAVKDVLTFFKEHPRNTR